MKTLYLITLWWPLFAVGRIFATKEQPSPLIEHHNRDLKATKKLLQQKDKTDRAIESVEDFVLDQREILNKTKANSKKGAKRKVIEKLGKKCVHIFGLVIANGARKSMTSPTKNRWCTDLTHLCIQYLEECITEYFVFHMRVSIKKRVEKRVKEIQEKYIGNQVVKIKNEINTINSFYKPILVIIINNWTKSHHWSNDFTKLCVQYAILSKKDVIDCIFKEGSPIDITPIACINRVEFYFVVKLNHYTRQAKRRHEKANEELLKANQKLNEACKLLPAFKELKEFTHLLTTKSKVKIKDFKKNSHYKKLLSIYIKERKNLPQYSLCQEIKEKQNTLYRKLKELKSAI